MSAPKPERWVALTNVAATRLYVQQEGTAGREPAICELIIPDKLTSSERAKFVKRANLLAASPALLAVAKRWLRIMGDAGADRCGCRPEEKYVCCRCEVVGALERVEGIR